MGAILLGTVAIATVLWGTRVSPKEQDDALDVVRMLGDLRALADDSMEGRATGSPGNDRARGYITEAFGQMGLEKVYDGLAHQFAFSVDSSHSIVGTNIVGRVRGSGASQLTIVLSAHFDHLGIRGGRIFNGADDNASGVAAMLAIARYFAAHRPAHQIIFAAFDAEEVGLRGSQAFVSHPPLDLSRVAVDVNLDMVSHSDSLLFVSGTYHYPQLRSIVEGVMIPDAVALRFGHDQPSGRPGDDWTGASDHGPFHRARIPFLYFGVEDHPDYHQPTDDVDRINEPFFEDAANFILRVIEALDRNLDGIVVKRSSG